MGTTDQTDVAGRVGRSGERPLKGAQTSGRTYRNLSKPDHNVVRINKVAIPTRDGTVLYADLFLPTAGRPSVSTSADGSVTTDATITTAPALVAFSCYARQAQDLKAPFGFIEAGVSDYFVSRGYAHVIINARGTGGSEGTFALADSQERRDTYDAIEWVASQSWCDGGVGGIGISYFAQTQLGAAVQRPPHLKAIFPFATLDDMYNAVWHNGVFNSSFFSSWMSAIGIMAGASDKFWSGGGVELLRHTLELPFVRQRMDHVDGETAAKAMRTLLRTHYAEEPFGRLWQEAIVEHPTHDAWWDDRNIREELAAIDIPVYLGCQWDNVPLHLPSSFPIWDHLTHNPNVRLTLFDKDGLMWPWETMHEEVLAWNDHWLKGRDTGIMDGPPIRYVIPGTNEWRAAEVWPPAESRHVAYALRADGVLDTDEGSSGSRSYLYLPKECGRPRNANPPTLPDHLSWQTAPVSDPVDVLGEIELELDATITALDTAWFVLLDDLGPDGTATNLSAGWLRAQLRAVDEENSRTGRPVLPLREPEAVPVGEPVRYRIPIVPNARRIAAGHRLRLLIASSDDQKNGPTVLGFTHTTNTPPSVNTVHSTSRLLLPLAEPRADAPA